MCLLCRDPSCPWVQPCNGCFIQVGGSCVEGSRYEWTCKICRSAEAAVWMASNALYQEARETGMVTITINGRYCRL